MAIIHQLHINAGVVHNIEQAQETALYKTMDALHTDLVQSQTMPFDTGTMQNNSTFVSQSPDKRAVALITRTPYAARVYYHPEYHFQTVSNPHAQGRWMETYLTGAKMNFCKDKFAEFLRRELGI